jgi:putative transposase
MCREPYSSDLTDAQWQRIAPLIPPAKPGGRHRSVDIRAVLNAIFYRTKTGCQWRNLPHDLPPWGTAAGYYRLWRRSGVWERIHDALREQVRVKAGREVTPSAAIIDSQSVKTTEKGGCGGTTRASTSTGANGISS